LLLGLMLGATAATADIAHPDTAGMDPALAEQIEAARELVETAAELEPDEQAEAWGELGMLYQATGYAKAGLSAYERAAELDPFDGRWPYLAGIVLGERGETDAARARLLAAIALNSALAEAGWARIGRLFLDAGRPEPARRAFDRALAIDEESAAALAGQGEALLALEEFALARDFLKRALDAEPRADRLHYPLAMALRGLGEASAMREHLAQAGQVGVTPDDPVAEYLAAHAAGSRVHILRGRKAWQAGDAAGAAQAFGQAAQADPGSAVAWTNLGTAQAELGRLDDARASLSTALELDPGAEQARQNLVSVLRRLDRPEQALEMIEDAPGELASSRWRLIESARLLFGLGQASAAADRLLEALDLARDLDLWTEALTALVRADRHEEARELATHEDLSAESDGRLAAWLGEMLRAAEAGSADLDLAARLSEHLYRRNREGRFAALRINTLLQRHGRCREALDWIDEELGRPDNSAALNALLERWARELAESADCARPDPGDPP
jgi:tetratricopeptide (TPR) repeat protein